MPAGPAHGDAPRPARGRKAEIVLRPIGPTDRALLEALASALARRFERPARIGPGFELDPAWYAPERDQYRADAILDRLVERFGAGPGLSLGVTPADLYVPGLNFVFGQATVGGCCAVIGLARLRTAGTDTPDAKDALFFRRALTEAVHELGHVLGLEHCPDSHCAMHFSNTLADTDRKGPDLCPHCTARALSRPTTRRTL